MKSNLNNEDEQSSPRPFDIARDELVEDLNKLTPEIMQKYEKHSETDKLVAELAQRISPLCEKATLTANEGLFSGTLFAQFYLRTMQMFCGRLLDKITDDDGCMCPTCQKRRSDEAAGVIPPPADDDGVGGLPDFLKKLIEDATKAGAKVQVIKQDSPDDDKPGT